MATLDRGTHVSPETYLDFERKDEWKNEYFNGVIYAMPGVSYPHALINTNLIAALGNQLHGTPFGVLGSGMRLRVTKTGLYTYADGTVTYGSPDLEDAHEDTLLNPRLTIEVLSPSTEAYDRGEKFAHYRTLDSLQEYVLVSQDRYRVERFVRQNDGRWILTEAAGPESEIKFESIGCQLPLAEVYDGVAINPSPELRPPTD
jgi:Uma2 family endonuclease